jgi:F-type H+-transporting ATPase subunit b
VSPILSFCSSRRGLPVVITGLLLIGAPELAAAEESGGDGSLQTIAKLVNFAALVGILVYFLKAPITRYLADRADTVRRDLVAAETLRATAQTQLADVEARLQALPGELEALAARGRDELGRERERLKASMLRERDKLLESTRREIELQSRVARRDLTEHAADLAMDLARTKIAGEMTPEDQNRLVDRYAAEVRS